VRRDRLSPYDQNRLDLGLAALRGDREAQLVAARAAVALVPVGTARFALITALKAVNRPREALSEMEGAMRGGATEGPMTWYALWGLWTELYHLVGRHEKELEVAREARAGLAGSLPTMEYEGRALAALGHLDEARALTEEVLTARAHPQITAGDVLLAIARELRAHGHPVLAGELADRAIAWYDAQAAVAIARGRRRDLKASLLYFRGRWSEAAAAWDSVPPDSANAVGRVGVRGVLAARMGLADSARTVATELAQLDRPRLNGQHTLWRARIAAVLGDQEAAVTLLRQAFAQGVGYGTWLHTDVDLEALWDYRPFRELVRPRG
jgi:tetratricopeptide (TPR) repeat protein